MICFWIASRNFQTECAGFQLAKSSAMMKGRRWHLFCLYLTFIGWGLLAILTCGIGVLWLTPYMQSAFAAFYEDARADFEAQQAAEAPQQATL